MLGLRNLNGKPHLDAIVPSAALPGGDVSILGTGLRSSDYHRPQVKFSDISGSVLICADNQVVARVPEGAVSGPVVVIPSGQTSNALEIKIAVQVADGLHPVTNPAVDHAGNIFATFSGSRGQKVPISVYKIDTNYHVKPFLAEMMNATAIAFDRAGQMYVSSRFNGTVYRVAPNGTMSAYSEGMGIATGMAFDADENLYVGDRSGTIFKIARDRQIYVFATLEPSVSAYHLAFNSKGILFVTGPTTSSYNSIYAIDAQGNTTVFYRGLGRPQGLAFDQEDNLYVAASLKGKRGIVRITPQGAASLVVAGQGLVGLAFAPGKAVVLATTSSIFHLSWGIQGRQLA